MALPTAVPICIWKASMAATSDVAVERRRLRHLGAAGEGDEADLDVLGQVAQEGLGRLLRGHHAGRLDVA